MISSHRTRSLMLVVLLSTLLQLGCGLDAAERRQEEAKAAKDQQRQQIQAIAAREDEIGKSIGSAMRENPKDMVNILRSMNDQLKHLDLTGCPQDFKEAEIDFMFAVDEFVTLLGAFPDSFMEQLDIASADVLAGRTYDSTMNQKRAELKEAFKKVVEAQIKMVKVGAAYDVK